mgnify:FL=1
MTNVRWRALAAELEAGIRSGRLAPGSPLPPLRARGAVHADPVRQRAYQELQARGLAVSAPGKGWFVVDDLPGVAVSLEERVAALEAWRVEVEGRG